MRRRGEVAGLPVVVIDSGRALGHVKDAVFDLARGRLTGLVVSCRGGDTFLAFDQVYSLGETAVTIGAEAVLLPLPRTAASSAPAVTPAASPPVASEASVATAPAGSFPKGRRVFTRDGQVLGQVDDVIFDPDSGAVWGYEITGGFIHDFINGRKAVPLTEEIVIGPDAVVVPEPDEMRPADGGGMKD